MRLVLSGLLSLLLACSLGLVGCSNSGAASLQGPVAHMVAFERQHLLADSACDHEALERKGVDLRSPSASETVGTLLKDSERYTKRAHLELKLAKMEFRSAPDSATRTQWLNALDEYEQAMAAHDDYFSARSADLRQLTVTGMCETEIPLTVSDMAQAWAFVDPPELSRTIADTSFTNFGNLAAELDRAHKLEPAAELDHLRDLMLREQEIAGLVRSARDSEVGGNKERANQLIKRAERLDAQLKEDVIPMSELAIFANAYRDRFERLQQHEDQHFSAAVRILEALDSGGQ